MAIVHESVATTTGNASSIDATLPAGIVAGDVMVAQYVFRASSPLDTPTGWVEVASADSGALQSPTVKVSYRVVDGTETSTCLFRKTTTGAGNAQSAVGIMRFSGVNATVSDATVTAGSGNNASAIAPTTSTATASAMVIVLYGLNSATATITACTGVTESFETTANARSEGDYIIQDAAGNTGAKQADLSAAVRWVAFQWALKPAAGAAGGTPPPGVLQPMGIVW